MNRGVAIVGYMGSGKSTVGRSLARELGWEFVDLDRTISKEAGRSIPEIFERSGEGYFRDLEHRALVAALDGSRDGDQGRRQGNTRGRVVACGGGIVVRSENRERLEAIPTVFLREDTRVLYARTRGAGRPLRASSLEVFERRYAERLPLYEEVADLEVPICGRPSKEVAREIARWIRKE